MNILDKDQHSRVYDQGNLLSEGALAVVWLGDKMSIAKPKDRTMLRQSKCNIKTGQGLDYLQRCPPLTHSRKRQAKSMRLEQNPQ